MAYWGYLKFIKSFLDTRPSSRLSVLEVGLDMGQSFVPLFSYMTHNLPEFELVGCDIVLRPELKALLALMGEECNTKLQNLIVYESSSLDLLPKLLDMKRPGHELFDVIMIDGDHNYYTVSEELRYCKELIADHGFIVVDDYNTRYAHKDLYYSETERFKDVKNATKRENTEGEKKGVRPAVDDFLKENPDWFIDAPEDEDGALLFKAAFLTHLKKIT